MVTMDHSEIANDADKVICLDNGELIYTGEQEEILCKSSQSETNIKLNQRKRKKNFDDYNPVLMKIKHLGFSYEKDIFTIENISFDIHPGKILGIVGQNGSGKSTMAKILSGICKPKKGHIEIEGEKITKAKRAKLTDFVGLIVQNPKRQFVTNSVEEDILITMKCNSDDKNLQLNDVEYKIDEILEQAGLSDLKQAHPLSLSAGEQQRLAIAIMTLYPKKILIFDEPTYGLDWKSIKWVKGMISKLVTKDISFILISQDMKIISEIADRVLVLSKGKVIFDDLPDKLFRSPQILKDSSLEPPSFYGDLASYQPETK